MNDLITHSHTDELSESEAALLFGGAPALPVPAPLDPWESREMTPEAARAAILADMFPEERADPSAAGWVEKWVPEVAAGRAPVRSASNSVARALAGDYWKA